VPSRTNEDNHPRTKASEATRKDAGAVLGRKEAEEKKPRRKKA
jgi:hypothetical protein